MGKVISFILSFTKVGKILDPIRNFLSGHKSYLAGLALAVPALITILTKFSDQGLGYLVTVTSTPEWAVFLNGLAIMGLRAAIARSTDTPTVPPIS